MYFSIRSLRGIKVVNLRKLAPYILTKAMKFMCPECGRRDEIIGDAGPRCTRCGAPMLAATESYKGLLINPKFVIERMTRLVQTYGLREVEASGRFKQEREAWTSAVWALGLSEMNPKDYWVEVVTDEQTPDTRVHYLDQSTGDNHVMTCNVEVVDWETHVHDPMQLIGAKCAKAYPDYFFLVLLARSGKVVYPQMIANDVRGIAVPFAEIWMLGRASDSDTLVHMARLHPLPVVNVDFDLREALNKTRSDPMFLQRQTRGRGTEFTSLGPIYLPIP